MANRGQTKIGSANRSAADNLQYKAHAEDGYHILTDTSAAPEGNYYAFLVVEEAVIASITEPSLSKISGDITLVTYPAGWYNPVLFTTLTLSSGVVHLLKYVNKQ